jgi:hypothetical protein
MEANVNGKGLEYSSFQKDTRHTISKIKDRLEAIERKTAEHDRRIAALEHSISLAQSIRP